jgi:hypothetical protein
MDQQQLGHTSANAWRTIESRRVRKLAGAKNRRRVAGPCRIGKTKVGRGQGRAHTRPPDIITTAKQRSGHGKAKASINSMDKSPDTQLSPVQGRASLN